jgi:hypothetical protein
MISSKCGRCSMSNWNRKNDMRGLRLSKIFTRIRNLPGESAMLSRLHHRPPAYMPGQRLANKCTQMRIPHRKALNGQHTPVNTTLHAVHEGRNNVCKACSDTCHSSSCSVGGCLESCRRHGCGGCRASDAVLQEEVEREEGEEACWADWGASTVPNRVSVRALPVAARSRGISPAHIFRSF